MSGGRSARPGSAAPEGFGESIRAKAETIGIRTVKIFNFFLHIYGDYSIFATLNNSLKRLKVMKKFFSFAIVMAAAAMISCGGNSNSQAAAEEAEATAVEATECCGECCEKADSCACACCGEAAAEEASAADAE